ncbi:MAG: copper resistance protein NlpE [Chitinophagaceae bacterium]
MQKNHFFYGIVSILLSSFFLMNTTSCNNDQKNQDSLEIQLTEIHNANNSLDWVGTYEGMLPCADCEGIAIILEINQDNTFKKSATYKNQSNNSFADSGRIIWDSTGSIITLKNQDFDKYKVEENRLRMLDKEGKIITGNLVEHYILKKK